MNLNRKKLDELIMEVMQEKFDLSQFLSFGSYDKTQTQAGADPLGGTVGAKDIFDTFKDKGEDKARLDVTDIEYYKDNPEKITTGVQQKLIAISRAGGRGDEARYDTETKRRKRKTLEYAVFKGGTVKVGQIFDEYRIEILKANPDIVTALKKNPRSNAYKAGAKALLAKAIEKVESMMTKDPPSTGNSPYMKRYNSWKFHSNPQNKTKLQNMAKMAEQALGGLDRAIAKAGSDKQTITSPEFKSQRGDTGAFPPEQQAVVKRLLTQGSIEGRITEVGNIAKKYYEAATSTNASASEKLKNEAESDPSKILSEIQLLDLFNTMVKEIDSGSGAYVFEYFLALISGGTVLGKAKTDSGRMGAADFQMGDEFGSAKFYKQGTNVTQAVSGYVDMLNKAKQKDPNTKSISVTYVVGLKKQDASQKGSQYLGSSDPARIIGVEIFTPKVVWDGTKFEIDGAEVPHGKKIKLDSNLGNSKGFVYITEMRTRTFRQMMSNAITKTKEDFQQVFQEFKNYFDMLEKADESAKVYVADNDPETRINRAENVYSSLQGAQSSFDKVKVAIDKPTPTPPAVEENKKNEINSLKALDKLIERVILYKNTEEK